MKFKSFLAAHKTLIKDVTTSTCLLGASAGIVFGVSAGMFSIRYMKLSGAEDRLNAYKNHSYASEKIYSAWNMNPVMDGETTTIKGYDMPVWQDMRQAIDVDKDSEAIEWWSTLHGSDNEHLWDKYTDMAMDKEEGEEISDAQKEARYKYTSMVIDGATHSTMDRSFNQGLYEGLADFNHNAQLSTYDAENSGASKNSANSYKPSQDNTTDFINTYNSVIKEHDVVGLAGFNHSTPLTTMMTHNGDDPIARNADPEIDKELNSTGLILLDSNIGNNQNVASVQFRADQPGFLSAIATCQYFYNNLDIYHDKYQDLAVAGFGGVAIPTVTIYLGGFQRGIEFFNYTVLSDSIIYGMKYWTGQETADGARQTALLNTLTNLIEHSKYKDEINGMKSKGADEILKKHGQQLYDEFEVKMIKLGDFDAHFSGTFAAGDAIGITKQYLNRGASAIIAVAGPQSLDSAQEIRNQNSKCIVIGVDSAMEDGDYQRFHQGCDESTKTKVKEDDKFVDQTADSKGNRSQQANAIIKFSAIKDIKTVSKKITRLCAEGKNWDVNTVPWNHTDKVEWLDANKLTWNDCVVSDIDDEEKTCTIALKNTWNKTQLIIPTTITNPDDNEEYEITSIAAEGFKNKIDAVEALKFENINRISVSDSAFEMSSPDASQMKFVEFPNYGNSFDFGYWKHIGLNSFANWPTRGNGKIIFGDKVYDGSKTTTYYLMQASGHLLPEWGIVEPDPEKSVCGPGFQTCGNIQNGLISISYDGFIPFMQAMKCVPFYDNDGSPMSVVDAWFSAATAYVEECTVKQIPLDENYANICTSIDSLMTFARTNEDGTPNLQYKNYSHTIAILGILLDQAKIPFTADMTLVPDGQGGFTTLTGTDPINLSIIDWLDYNMYMMS